MLHAQGKELAGKIVISVLLLIRIKFRSFPAVYKSESTPFVKICQSLLLGLLLGSRAVPAVVEFTNWLTRLCRLRKIRKKKFSTGRSKESGGSI